MHVLAVGLTAKKILEVQTGFGDLQVNYDNPFRSFCRLQPEAAGPPPRLLQSIGPLLLMGSSCPCGLVAGWGETMPS